MKAIIFGCGGIGVEVKRKLENEGMEILTFVDNDEKKWGKSIGECRIDPPDKIMAYDYDYVAVAMFKHVEEVKEQLKAMDIPKEKIIVPIKPPNRIFPSPVSCSDFDLLKIPKEEYGSETTRRYLERNIPIRDKAFLEKLEDLKSCLYENRIPRSKVCVVSGAVLQAFALRPSKKFDDIDIIMTSELREIYGKGLVIVSDSAEMHPQNEYRDSDDEIINDQRKHFIFRDLKFMTLELLYEHRRRHRSGSDTQEEIQLMERYLIFTSPESGDKDE